jgi:SAM-dependent methyltransferase
MSDAAAATVPGRRALRRWLHFAVNTPLHPKWLVVRHRAERIRWVASRAGGLVLDVGCAGSALRPMLRCERYVGLDHPETAVGLYRTRPDAFADASHLPIVDASVDTVLLVDVLEHVLEPDTALAEAARVIKPGGKVLITMPFSYPMHDQPHDFQRWTVHGWKHRLRRAGLKAVVIEENGSAAEAAAANLCMALAQGGLEALARRSWRAIAMVLLPPLVLASNLCGLLAGWLLPARDFMPAGYLVEAQRL